MFLSWLLCCPASGRFSTIPLDFVCVCDLDLGRWLFVSFPEANIQRVRQMGRCSSDVTRSYPAGCNVEIHCVADQIVSGRWRGFGLAKVIPMVSVPL
jgi:hypothetical protein